MMLHDQIFSLCPTAKAPPSTDSSELKRAFYRAQQNEHFIIKAHSVPNKSLIDSFLAQPEQRKALQGVGPCKMLEQFYDTTFFNLLRKKCWLRRRVFCDSGEEEWCFQEQSATTDDGFHLYVEVARGEKEHVLHQMKETCKEELHCSKLIASFLTYRYDLGNRVHLDHCFFDVFDPKDDYWVATFTSKTSSSLLGILLDNAWPTHSKVAEYLRRNNPYRFHQLTGCTANPPPFCEDGRSLLDELFKNNNNKPTTSELRSIDPRVATLREGHAKFREKLIRLKQRSLPDLLHNKEFVGKWALLREDGVDVFSTREEAMAAARDKKCEPFVAHITEVSLLSEDDDGDILLCCFAPDHNNTTRIWAPLCFKWDQAREAETVSAIVDTGCPLPLVLLAEEIQDMSTFQPDVNV